MFLMIGISPGRKDFDYSRQGVCSSCGKYDRCSVFMTYMVFSLFFIPIIKWNRHYFAKSRCCRRVREISYDVGKRIARGEEIELQETDFIDDGQIYGGYTSYKRCMNCGYETEEDFEYCPKCGRMF